MRYLGPVILLSLMALLVVAGLREFLHMRSPWDAKIARAQSVMYYEVSGEKPLKMKIYETDRSIRVISHIGIKSAGYTYNPERRYTYCIEATIYDTSGKELWRHEYWIETRQSKDNYSDGIWGMECAFTTTGLEVSDDRLTFILLPDGVPQGESILELRLKGYEEGSGFVRAYRSLERNGMEIARAELTMTDEEKQRLADRVFRSDWRELTRLERQLMLRNEWQRIPPYGVSGVDYHTRQLYFTGFHLSGEIQPVDEGLYLDPGAGTALNLKGPVEVKIYGKISPRQATFEEQKFRLALSEAPIGPEDIDLSLLLVKTPGTVDNRNLKVSAYGGFFREFTAVKLSAGEIAGLSLVNRSGHPLRIMSLLAGGDENSVLGEFQLEPSGISGMKAIVPAPRYYSAFRIKPEGDSLKYRLFGLDSPSGGQTLRVVAYPVMDCKDLASEVEIKTLLRDSTGEVVFEASNRIDAVVSPFEDYPATDPAQKSCVGAAQNFYIRYPDGEHVFELSSKSEIDVIVQSAACLYCEDRKHASLQSDIEPLKWRNEIMEISRWFSMNPLEEDRLTLEDRSTVIRARMRIEAPDELPVDPALNFVTLAADGAASSSAILEQAQDGADLYGAWNYAAYTAVQPESEFSVTVPHEYLGRPALVHCELSEEVRGRIISIEVDGKPQSTHNLRMSSGDIMLPLKEGRHRIVLRGGLKADRFWINLPVDNAALSRHFFERTVYRLEAGSSLSFSVAHRAGIKQTLNILAYESGAAAGGSIKASFDGGRPYLRQPALASGVTQAYKEQKIISPGPSDSLLAVERKAAIYGPSAMFMTLFEDAGAGTHKLTLSSHGRSSPLWVRVFAVEETPQAGKGFMIWKSSKR